MWFLRSAVAILVCVSAGLSHAAEISGQVLYNGLALPGVTVTVSQGNKTTTAITDPDGVYSLTDLYEGIWVFRLEKLLFQPQQTEIEVTAGLAPARWEMKLLSPEAMPTIADASTGTQAIVTRKAPTDETPKKPAPQTALAELTKEPPVDGLLINGSAYNAATSVWALPSAFGNGRPGSRSLYNGSLGLIAGNSALDARPYSLTGQNTAKPAYNRVQGLLSFGGPIRIPRFVQNGPVVVMDYQWLRNRNALLQTGLVPTESQRSGVVAGTVLDPVSGMPFPGSVIPQNRISAQARALLALYPLPNLPSSRGYNFQSAATAVTHQDNLQSRVNKQLSGRDQVRGSFAFQSSRSDATSLFGFLDKSTLLGLNASAAWTHRFGQRTFATLTSQFSRLAVSTTSHFENRENVSGLAGITGNNQEPMNWGPPTLSFASGITSLTDAVAGSRRNQTNGVGGAVNWSRAGHNVTFGTDYKRQQFNIVSQTDPRGTFTFTGSAAGSDFGSFLLGIPDTSSIAFGNADKYFRGNTYAAYINDDWRVGPGLTLDGGLRWEYGSPLSELRNRLVNLDIAPGFAAVIPVLAVNPSGGLTGARYPRSLLRPTANGIAPRVGFAWHPMLASSLVVRGGYGVYYDTSVYSSVALQMSQQAPLSRSLAVQNSPATPLTLASGFNAQTASIATFAVDPDFRAGYAQNWSLSAQRDLPLSLVVTALYQGIKGTHGRQLILPNTYPLGASNPCNACPAGFTYLESGGNSTRQAGQLQLRRRLAAGLAASVQYTFSKSIDNAALGGQASPQNEALGNSNNLVAQNWLDLHAERGRSNFDRRHVVDAQLQYSTGVGVGGGALLGGWRGRAVRDWTLLMRASAGSGLPLTPIYPQAVGNTGVTGSIRPQSTGASLYDAPQGLGFNPAAFSAPSPGQWGNAGRNTITGPSLLSVNSSVARSFRLTDRLTADLRVDATNPVNHPTFSAWSTVLGSAQFGFPLGANAMRSLQTSLRVRF